MGDVICAVNRRREKPETHCKSNDLSHGTALDSTGAALSKRVMF